MVQQTFSGVPGDPSPGDVIRAADADKVRDFLLALVKDGTESTTGQTSNLLFDATDGNWELEGATVGVATAWNPALTVGSGTDPSTSSAAGTYVRVGNMVTCWARFVMSSGGSGDLRCNLPLAADTTLGGIVVGPAAAGTALGSFNVHDDSDSSVSSGGVFLSDSAQSVEFLLSSSVLDAGFVRLSSSGDVFTFTATYPVASA